MNSLVSVIIPTYNRLELLKRAIESVKNQSYSNMEIIIIDGSTNNETQLFLELMAPNRNNTIINLIHCLFLKKFYQFYHKILYYHQNKNLFQEFFYL